MLQKSSSITLAAVLAHILEDVGVPPEGHRQVGVAEHPGDCVERDACKAKVPTESRQQISPLVFGRYWSWSGSSRWA